MITLPETNRSVKAVLFIYCCKGVSAGYCFLVKRIFAPAAHEKVWIFHYVKKTFYQRNFTSYICRFVKQTYGVLLQNIPVTHYWCTWAWYLSAYTSTADSDHVHLRFRYPDCNLPPHCRRKNFQKSQSSYLRLFCRGNCIFCCFLLVFSWFLYSYADFWAVQILKESQTSGLIRILSLSIPLSTLHTCISSYYLGRKQAGFPAGVQLLEQLFRTGGCYILYLICASQGRNITPAIAVGGNLIGEIASSFISLFAVSMHFKVTHYNIRNIRRPLSVLRKLLHISVPLTMNKILLTLLGSIEVILIPARLQMSGLTPKDSLSVYGIFTGMALPLILFPATLTNSAAAMLIPSITQLQTLGYQKRIQYVIGKIFRYCLLLGGSCLVFFLFLGEFLGNFLFHSQTAGIYIHTMSYICPFLYLNTTLTSVLNGLGKSGICLLHSVISVCIRISFVLFAIPVLGIRGYLYGILCSELALSILHSLQILQNNYSNPRK